MTRSLRTTLTLSTLLAVLLLAACGGGGDSYSSGTAAAAAGGPQFTGNTATDGFNWFNYRRQQLGLAPLTHNNNIDVAAQGHSNYQQLNDTITHTQIVGKPGFTGVTLADRLAAAGYRFTRNGYAYGEVISSTGDTSGFNAADDLITAIYHRFVIFEPAFKEAGVGAATSAGGTTYFTTDFAANGLDSGLGVGRYVVYPFSDQRNVPIVFYSDNETPDPVPNRNAVGYPISVHADATASVAVLSFTLRPRGGSPLAVQLLSNANDALTPASAAAIIPLDVLASGTTFDVQFVGTVDSVPVSRYWSFTTR